VVRSAPAVLLAALVGLLGACGSHHAAGRELAGPPESGAGASRSAGAAGHPAPRFNVVVLRVPSALRGRPGGRVLARLAPRTEFGSRRVLAVVGRRRGWLRVLAPQLPNGATGWLPERGARMYAIGWRVDVWLGRRLVKVSDGPRVVQRFRVAVGGSANPTPTGRFAVTDKIRMRDPAGPYGCCALALTGHQPHVPQGWSGGDRLAIHGTDDPASIGHAVSLGCLRARAEDARRLITTVPAGAPVFIHA
jgi:hypothetical protein